MGTYVHGYSETEAYRLADQADTLVTLLHGSVSYPPGSKVLEAGCGVGAQTVFLAKNSPGARITSFDVSSESVARARRRVEEEGLSNVTLEIGDIFQMRYEPGSFDHVFLCFVLEHLPNPSSALIALAHMLKPGGTITVTEGDHGSYYCYPRSKEADLAVQCLIEIQARKHGNSLIGRELYPLLKGAGFRSVEVSPRMVYVDSSKPELVEGFTKRTFNAMVEGVREEALALGLMDETTWEKGIRDLYRTTREDGTFCYTFFQAQGLK
jgi:ubiquinone/menaquinone biosynthesis C-methylase UbiE